MPGWCQTLLGDRELHHQQECRLTHSTRADDDNMLHSCSLRLTPDQRNQFVYEALTRNKGVFDLLCRHLVRVIEMFHDYSPAAIA